MTLAFRVPLRQVVAEFAADRESMTADTCRRYRDGRAYGTYHARIAGNSPVFFRLSTWLTSPDTIAPADPSERPCRGDLLYRAMVGRSGSPAEVSLFWSIRAPDPWFGHDTAFTAGWCGGAMEILSGLDPADPAVPAVPAVLVDTDPAGYPEADGPSASWGSIQRMTEGELQALLADLHEYYCDPRIYQLSPATFLAKRDELTLLDYALPFAVRDRPLPWEVMADRVDPSLN